MSADARDGNLTSVIIVAADSGPLLLQSAASAFAGTTPVELIVVDNASTDGIPARAAERYRDDPRFRLISNAINRGFGPACNQGAAVARGDALLFLNPDCLIERGSIAALRTISAPNRSIGLLGVDVRALDGTPARGNRRRDPTLRRAFMTVSGLARFEARWPALAGVEMPARLAPAAGVESVEAVSGACMFMPRAVFDEVGGFDEGYFMHVEDLDLCRRIRDAGYGVAIANSLPAFHAQGSSSHHRPLFVAWHKQRGMWRYFTKFDAQARNPLLRSLAWLGLWTRFAVSIAIHATAAVFARRQSRAITP